MRAEGGDLRSGSRARGYRDVQNNRVIWGRLGELRIKSYRHAVIRHTSEVCISEQGNIGAYKEVRSVPEVLQNDMSSVI